jgi:peptidyl-prolyl cis-trans isomerase C
LALRSTPAALVLAGLAFIFGFAKVVRAEPMAAASATAPAMNTCVKVGRFDVSVTELEDRLARVPLFQLSVFGSSAVEIRRAFVAQVLVPELLQIEKAEREKLTEDAFVRVRLSRAMGNAALRKHLKALPTRAQIAEAQVKTYYDAHISEYQSPEQILVHRISVATEAEAKTLIEEFKKSVTVKDFAKVARDKSLDKATYLRGGDLGFLTKDGSSEQGFPVDPEVFRAAATVKDGELVLQPVKEAQNFAVVWRRGSKPAVARTLKEADEEIRKKLVRADEERATKELLAKLRAEHVKGYDATGLASFDIELTADLPLRNTAQTP